MSQAVFVVGRRRSGTKWLSNILARHPDIATVQGRRSGILETCMFDKLPDLFGDLTIDTNFYAFVACYGKTDFFRHTGIPESDLVCVAKRDYHQTFRAIMNEHARRQHRPIWLQKSSSYLLPELMANFPDAKFIVIRRRMLDNVRSNLGSNQRNSGGKRPGGGRVLSTLLSYHYHRKSENQYLQYENVMAVAYEDLRSNTTGTVESVCRFLGVDFVSAMLETGYEPNTSYSGGVRKEEVLGPAHRLLISLANPLIRTLPLPLLRLSFTYRSRFLRQPFQSARLLPGYFNSMKKEHEDRLTDVGEQPRQQA